MEFSFRMWTATAGLLLGCACAPPRSGPSPAPDGSDVQRLVGLLDYVAADYGSAVEAGRIVSEAEYEEQRQFVEDARILLGRVLTARDPAGNAVTDPLSRDLAAIGELVAEKQDAALVSAQCHSLKNAVVDRFGLRTSPPRRPNLARARELYAQSCLPCHGADGRAETERARTLNPRPANFRDPEVRLKLSPYRAFNTLTFGVSGTGMASFEALSPDERWSLAFYVMTLAHQEEAPPVPASMILADLASLNDEETLADLTARGHPQPARALSYLRTVSPYQEPSLASGLTETRLRLRRAVTAYNGGQKQEADGLLLDAYLEGFEPLEPRLRARDPHRTAAVEKAFSLLRAAVRNDAGQAEVDRREKALEAQLAASGEPGSPLFPFLAAALIYLREGAEAALLVGALLAAVRKIGEPAATRFIHAGWMAAVPAGLLTWWGLGRVAASSAAQRELVEAITALLAAAVLFWVSFWLISKAESRRWAEYLKSSVTDGVKRRSLLVLACMAFLAAYREAAETVLFTQALLLESAHAHAQVWAGALFGLLAVILLAAVMRRAVLKLPLGLFFAVSGVLLCLLSISFTGSGLAELIAAGYLDPRPVRFPELPLLGLQPDLTVLAVQSAILLSVGAAGLVTWRRASRT